jgi:predicted ABC-type transport system involved in lysophospholipase L1 biosynthesis ATPase subunit
MPPRLARTVLALEAAALTERSISGSPAHLDLDLRRGEVGMIHVDDDSEASAMVDLCVGLAMPASGRVRFLGVDWATRTRPQRLHRRRRVGVVAQTEVWPAQMTIMESILLAPLYHSDRSRDELIAEATGLARLFGLPGLPAEPREATRRQALLRAGCVRGFLGSPDLVLVHDQLLDRTSELAIPMAQAVSMTRARGGAVLWLTAGMVSPAAQHIEADLVYRLGDAGLIRMRRSQ